jgi:hypothetical protein
MTAGEIAVELRRRITFVPAPHTAAVLRQNIGLHQLADVTVHEVALGTRPEHDVAFTYFPRCQEVRAYLVRAARRGSDRPPHVTTEPRTGVPGGVGARLRSVKRFEPCCPNGVRGGPGPPARARLRGYRFRRGGGGRCGLLRAGGPDECLLQLAICS